MKKLTITELNRIVRSVVEGGFAGGVWVVGELRQFKVHSSGHWYFTLRDKNCQVDCVMWRGDNASVSWTPQDGMEVDAFVFPTLFERYGKFQVTVKKLIPSGRGARAIAFEMLKKKLAQAGLFDPAHKKPLPSFPLVIGVVTSRTGAAIRDIVNVLSRRAPWVTVILRNTLVQGENAPADIVAAIEEFNAFGAVDLLIVGRGGGSEEDLWCFNDEGVAYAIFNSKLPIISAVGHEIDITIADLVADVRAPTPSAAAELATPDKNEITNTLATLLKSAANSTYRIVLQKKATLGELRRKLSLADPTRRIAELRQRLDIFQSTAQRDVLNLIERRRNRVSYLAQSLKLLSVDRILARGFSIVRLNGNVVRESSALSPHSIVSIEFYRGSARADVLEISPESDEQ